eukprot:COSAG06_NODE_10317_length_1704_cov_1.560748_1_plen_92_part_10
MVVKHCCGTITQRLQGVVCTTHTHTQRAHTHNANQSILSQTKSKRVDSNQTKRNDEAACAVRLTRLRRRFARETPLRITTPSLVVTVCDALS